MSRLITIGAEDDFQFLLKIFRGQLNKLKHGESGLDNDKIDSVVRIYDALSNAVEVKDESAKPKKKTTKKAPSRTKTDLCEKHPYYGAIRAPQGDCMGCWDAYKELNPMDYPGKRRKHERKKRSERKRYGGSASG